MTSTFDKAFDILTLFLLNPIRIKKFRVVGFENHFKFHILLLSSVYCFFSSILALYTFEENARIQLNMGSSLQFIQTSMPILISFYLAFDFVKEKKIVLSSKVSESLASAESIGCKFRQLKVILILASLLLIRGFKLYVSHNLASLAYSLSCMMPELMLSMSDFAFTFFVESVTQKITHFNHELRTCKLDMKTFRRVQERFEEFQELARDICRIYSSRLICTIFYNFIQLVVSLYWSFIRVKFNHMDSIKGIASFFYFVQPFLCIYTILHSTQQFTISVINYSRIKYLNLISQYFSEYKNNWHFVQTIKRRWNCCPEN